MTVIPFPGTSPALAIRAAAHATARLLAEEAEFRRPVTDLDIARLMYALDSGTPIVQGGNGWTVPLHSPLARRLVTRIANEAIRTGLAKGLSKPVGPDVVLVTLQAAPTHIRRGRDALRPVCDARALRYRLIRLADFRRSRGLVDCKDCLHAY